MRTAGITFRAWLTAATCLTGWSHPGSAQTTPAPTHAAAPRARRADAPPPGYWINGIHLSAVIEAGIIGNPVRPETQHRPVVHRPSQSGPVEPGSARRGKEAGPEGHRLRLGLQDIVHVWLGCALHALSRACSMRRFRSDQRNQLDIVEASGSLHIPVSFFEGGLDVKAGLYATPLGAELIDPSTNPFYSHSYIFNLRAAIQAHGSPDDRSRDRDGRPLPGVDTGTNTTLGPWGENNGAVGGIVGFGLNLMDGNLTVLALSHMGPENATRALVRSGSTRTVTGGSITTSSSSGRRTTS